jgi:hypothetical protein
MSGWEVPRLCSDLHVAFKITPSRAASGVAMTQLDMQHAVLQRRK